MPDQPNILFIVSDQMVASLTGAYGHPVVQTPGLDRLVHEGVRFDAAYTPFPLCAPGRACIMTGRHASEIGAWDNGALLRADQPTFAHYLADAGYDAVLSGKMHFIGPDQLHRFHRRLTTDIYSSDFNWVKPEWIRIKETQGRDFEDVMGSRSTYNAKGYTGEGVKIDTWHNALSYDEETHFRTLEYLRARGGKKEDGPFLICASYHHPHEPFWPPQAYWNMYEDAEIEIPSFPDTLDADYSMMDRNLNAYHGTRRHNLRDPDGLYRLRRAYYGLVTYMDRKVNELLDELDATGLADNTVVVFTSDHGDMLCEKEMVQKRCFYEWSAQIPMIVRFPDRWKAGTQISTPVSLVDILPTTLDMADVPTDKRLPHDGQSLMSLINSSDHGDRVAFAEIHSEGIHAPCFMVRRDRFKYIHVHGHDEQLFDVEADPGEWHNLIDAPEYQTIRADLKTILLQQFDPDEIDTEVQMSTNRRQLVREAMNRTGTSWDVVPSFDPRKNALSQYLP